jgi:hypothetical protein
VILVTGVGEGAHGGFGGGEAFAIPTLVWDAAAFLESWGEMSSGRRSVFNHSAQ